MIKRYTFALLTHFLDSGQQVEIVRRACVGEFANRAVVTAVHGHRVVNGPDRTNPKNKKKIT